MKGWVDETIRLSMIAKMTVRNLSCSTIEKNRKSLIIATFLIKLQKLIIICNPNTYQFDKRRLF
jgi:hypothetical protein